MLLECEQAERRLTLVQFLEAHTPGGLKYSDAHHGNTLTQWPARYSGEEREQREVAYLAHRWSSTSASLRVLYCKISTRFQTGIELVGHTGERRCKNRGGMSWKVWDVRLAGWLTVYLEIIQRTRTEYRSRTLPLEDLIQSYLKER